MSQSVFFSVAKMGWLVGMTSQGVGGGRTVEMAGCVSSGRLSTSASEAPRAAVVDILVDVAAEVVGT